MKRLFQFCLVITCLATTSCNVPTYFLPAVVGNDIAYLPKPMHSDSIKSKSYISGSYADLELPYGSGQLGMGFLNFSRGHTTKNLNIGYGVFGYAGKTYVSNEYHQHTISEFEDKTFLGGVFKMEAMQISEKELIQ